MAIALLSNFSALSAVNPPMHSRDVLQPVVVFEVPTMYRSYRLLALAQGLTAIRISQLVIVN